MPRIAVIGAGGQLGRELVSALGENAIPYTRAIVDFTQTGRLGEFLTQDRAEAVINAAAENRVDYSETNPLEAVEVNAYAVGRLAHLCQKMSLPLIHFSTDYVFDGSSSVPYLETDVPNPINHYGRSKLMGEMAVRMMHKHATIIRTSGLYAKGGSRGKDGSFVDRILKQAEGNGRIRVVTDQVTAPTYAKDLAAAVCLNLDRFFDHGGIYHLRNSGCCSWYNFAAAILGSTDKLEAVTTPQLNLPARRPRYSELANSHLGTMRSWQEALAEYLNKPILYA